MRDMRRESNSLKRPTTSPTSAIAKKGISCEEDRAPPPLPPSLLTWAIAKKGICEDDSELWMERPPNET